MPSPVAITVPATTMQLDQNRLGEMPFTVTNTTDRPLRGRASVVALDAAPQEWFSLAGKAELELPPRASAQILVRVEPPLGASAATHLFRVDVVDAAAPGAATVGPSCSVVVPPSEARVDRWKTPRGYLATLLGASAGGAVGELVILVGFLTRGEQDCTAVECEFENALGEVVFLIIAVLLGLVLLWIGAAIGAWIGLRVRRYLGAKTTALFLAVLMIPWTIAMLWVIGTVTDSLTVAAILAPVLLTAVPGLLARGAVLLLRTRHL